MKLVLELVVLVMLVKLKLMMLVLELVMLVILVKLDLFGFELLLMVLVELVLFPQKGFTFVTFHPNHSHFLATGHQVTLKRILSSLPTRKQATISAATTRVNIIIATIANLYQSPLPPFRLSPTMPWMKSTFGKHPAGCLWVIRWETKSCVVLQFCFFFNKTCFRQETCLGDFAKIWMILRLKSLLETKCLKFRTPSFCPPRYQRALLCEFLKGL